MINFFLGSELNARSRCTSRTIPSSRRRLPTEQAAHQTEVRTTNPTCDLADLRGLALAALRETGSMHPKPRILAVSCGLTVHPIGACNPVGVLIDQTIFYDERIAQSRISYVIAHEVAHYLLRGQRSLAHVDVVWLTLFLLCPQPKDRRSRHCPQWVKEFVSTANAVL